MTAIASLDVLINNLTGGGAVQPDHEWFYIADRVGAAALTGNLTFVAGRYTSLWRINKTNGANGAVAPASTAAVAPTRATIGALPFTNPTGGRQKFLLGMESGLAAAGSIIVYDRLAHCAGIVGSIGTTTLTGMAVSRYTGAASDGNQIWLEYGGTAAQAAATHAVTVSYTNQAGVAGRTSASVVPGTIPIQGMVPVPLQDGDTGVQSIQSITVATAAATTNATIGVVIARPLLSCISAGAAGGSIRDAISGLPAMPEVMTDACLAFMFFANTTTAPTGFVGLHLAEN